MQILHGITIRIEYPCRFVVVICNRGAKVMICRNQVEEFVIVAMFWQEIGRDGRFVPGRAGSFT